jgi:DNA-binding GntR family transcriptional regulator
VMPQRKPFPRDTVADDLRDRIGRGEFGSGALLPTLRELAAEYHCAENTARDALRILASRGLITIRPRQGSVVAQADRSIAGPAERLHRSALGGLFRDGEEQQVLRCYLTEGHPDARTALGVFDDDELGAREYLVRDAANVVVTYATSFVHPDAWAAVAELREQRPIPDGIIGAIRRVLGRETVGAPTRRQAAEATEEEATALGVRDGSPVLVEITECQLADGTVVEWNISVHPAGYWIGR